MQWFACMDSESDCDDQDLYSATLESNHFGTAVKSDDGQNFDRESIP